MNKNQMSLSKRGLDKGEHSLDALRGALTEVERKVLLALLVAGTPLSGRGIRNRIITNEATKAITITPAEYSMVSREDDELQKNALQRAADKNAKKERMNTILEKSATLKETLGAQQLEKEIKNWGIKIPSFATIADALYNLEKFGLVSERENPNREKYKDRFKESKKKLWFVLPKYRQEYLDGQQKFQAYTIELATKHPDKFVILMLNRQSDAEFYRSEDLYKAIQSKQKKE